MAQLSLPEVVATRADVLRLHRELEALDRYFSSGLQSGPAPRVSKNLQSIARDNSVDLNDAEGRESIVALIRELKDSAPVLHMSFASDPPANVVLAVVSWLRREAHPFALLQVGVQPNIAGGCTLRGTSKYFDFSLRRHFKDHQAELSEAISTISASVASEEVAS